LRIISGKYKGRAIVPDKNFKARPTTDFAKESLFNILNNHFNYEDLTVLDLFSGTGSIGYEFASRNCISVDMVELDFNHYQFIRKTLSTLGFNQANAIRGNVFQFLKSCHNTYDIIFADPPYDLEGIETLPGQVMTNKLLNVDGWLVVEHSKNVSFTGHPSLFDHRNYGSVNFSFFRNT
jgi:16S rRNA (guanine(966)-N(2))-methyltransferase RsmD